MQVEQMESIKTFGKEKVQAKIFQELFKLRYAKATCLFSYICRHVHCKLFC